MNKLENLDYIQEKFHLNKNKNLNNNENDSNLNHEKNNEILNENLNIENENKLEIINDVKINNFNLQNVEKENIIEKVNKEEDKSLEENLEIQYPKEGVDLESLKIKLLELENTLQEFVEVKFYFLMFILFQKEDYENADIIQSQIDEIQNEISLNE